MPSICLPSAYHLPRALRCAVPCRANIINPPKPKEEAAPKAGGFALPFGKKEAPKPAAKVGCAALCMAATAQHCLGQSPSWLAAPCSCESFGTTPRTPCAHASSAGSSHARAGGVSARDAACVSAATARAVE